MNILGIALKDALPVRIALTKFKGIGNTTSKHICRRLELNDGLKVHQLSEAQQNRLTAFLSDPSSVPYTPAPVQPLASTSDSVSPQTIARQHRLDPLENLLIESDLRREIRLNIAHHRNIGTLKGRRHAQGYPVRGQRTKTNARTAKRLNKLERNV